MLRTSPNQDVRDPRGAGYNAGFHGYRANTGDWSPLLSAAHHDAFRAGRADALAGAWGRST